jgi:putative intracellular protease/amidase
MAKKALIVVTNVEKYQEHNRPNGLWLGEAVHFYDELFHAGWSIDIASPKGGYTPIDPVSLVDRMDEVTWKCYADTGFRNLLGAAKKASDVNPNDYDVVFYAGGHGTVWDFYENLVLHEIS